MGPRRDVVDDAGTRPGGPGGGFPASDCLGTFPPQSRDQGPLAARSFRRQNTARRRGQIDLSPKGLTSYIRILFSLLSRLETVLPCGVRYGPVFHSVRVAESVIRRPFGFVPACPSRSSHRLAPIAPIALSGRRSIRVPMASPFQSLPHDRFTDRRCSQCNWRTPVCARPLELDDWPNWGSSLAKISVELTWKTLRESFVPGREPAQRSSFIGDRFGWPLPSKGYRRSMRWRWSASIAGRLPVWPRKMPRCCTAIWPDLPKAVREGPCCGVDGCRA